MSTRGYRRVKQFSFISRRVAHISVRATTTQRRSEGTCIFIVDRRGAIVRNP